MSGSERHELAGAKRASPRSGREPGSGVVVRAVRLGIVSGERIALDWDSVGDAAIGMGQANAAGGGSPTR